MSQCKPALLFALRRKDVWSTIHQHLALHSAALDLARGRILMQKLFGRQLMVWLKSHSHEWTKKQVLCCSYNFRVMQQKILLYRRESRQAPQRQAACQLLVDKCHLSGDEFASDDGTDLESSTSATPTSRFTPTPTKNTAVSVDSSPSKRSVDSLSDLESRLFPSFASPSDLESRLFPSVASPSPDLVADAPAPVAAAPAAEGAAAPDPVAAAPAAASPLDGLLIAALTYRPPMPAEFKNKKVKKKPAARKRPAASVVAPEAPLGEAKLLKDSSCKMQSHP